MPRLKEDKALPEILSWEEIARLLEHCENPKHKAIFALAYGSGLRVSEICALRVQDIDSKQMRVFVRNSKRDRTAIQSSHSSISPTTVYLHLANTGANLISPADRLHGNGR